MYEWETDFVEVPVPPMASREPPEPPETLHGSSREAASASKDAAPAYASYGGGPYNYAQHDANPGPSFLGAFSSLVNRVSAGGDNSRDDTRRNPSEGSSGDGAGETHIISLDEDPAPLPAPASAPPTQQSGPGWAYGFGWGRLFGSSDRDDRNRGEDPEDQFGAPTHARYVDGGHVEPSIQGRGVDTLADPHGKVSSRSREQEISGRIDAEAYRDASPPSSDSGADVRLDPVDDDDELHGIVGTIVYGAVKAYTYKFSARCPCCCASCYMCVFLIFIIVGVILMPVTVESNFDAFMKTDVNSSTLRDTFGAALQERIDNRRRLEIAEDDGANTSRRLQGAQLYMQNDVYVAYELRDGSSATSILDPEVITEIQKFEQYLTNLPAWGSLCGEVGDTALMRLCMPGISLINYARPTLDIEAGSIVPTQMNFDGQGRESVPMETALKLIHGHGLQRIVLPNGFTSADAGSVDALRSCFRFKFYCCTTMQPMSEQKRIVSKSKEEWRGFVRDTLFPAFRNYDDNLPEEEKLKHIHIFYDGHGMEEIEVLDTLFSDIWLALGSMGFVLFYLMFHTQSLFLSIVGLFIILLSVPLAYVVFAIIAQTTTLSIASFLSLFLVVGLGSDVVFVYTDFWRDAERLKASVPAQLAWTTKHGGKASLATTATTALSFFANLASTLRPLREFGVFMGFCVTFVWLLVTLVYVPLCAIDSRFCGLCSFRRCIPASDGSSSWQRAFASLTRGLFRVRRSCLVVFILFWIVSLISALTAAETDTGVPNIFPENHNQNRGKKVMDRFASTEDVLDALFGAPPLREEVCNEWRFRAEDPQICPVFWCEVQASIAWTNDPSMCKCYRKPKTTDCSGRTSTMANQRIVGTELSTDDLNGPIADYLVGSTASIGLSFSRSSDRSSMMQITAMNPILIQEWESGDTMLRPMTQVRTSLRRQNSDPEASCDFDELCFCGTYVCKLPEPWRYSGKLTIGIVRANYGGRSLQTGPLIAADQRASVNVVFGIRVEDSSPLLGELEMNARWGFFESFDLQQPWAQRNLYKFCSQLPPALKIVERSCWLEDFRDWLLERRERFPAPAKRFNSLVRSFVTNGLTGLLSSRDFLWMREGNVLACFVSFKVNMHKYAATEKAIAFMKTWDEEIKIYNSQASRYARGAWHTSQLWVRAEAQEALISSTMTTLIIVIVLAFFGMLAFTVDIMLSFFVIFATIGVLCNLAFFICVVMSWPIGPIEVIALIVFIGYAVTYSLHLAHLYGSGEALRVAEAPPRLDIGENSRVRYQRTVFALQAIGSAALGSACTTVGCSCFLLFCTLTIFQKLGGVVIAVTAMSIITALAPLPCLLMLMGPLEPGSMCGCGGLMVCGLDIYNSLTNILDRIGILVSKLLGHAAYDDSRTDGKPPLGFTHGTAGGGIRTMQPVAQPAGMRPSNSERELPPPSSDSWDAVERHSHNYSPRAQSSSPRAQALVNSAPRPALLPETPRAAAPVQPIQPSQPATQVDDVLLSEAFFDSKPFDIGTESPLEPIWSREIEQTSGRVRAIHEKSPRMRPATPRQTAETVSARASPRNTSGVQASPRTRMEAPEPVRASPRTGNRMARPEPVQASPRPYATSPDNRVVMTAQPRPRSVPQYVS